MTRDDDATKRDGTLEGIAGRGVGSPERDDGGGEREDTTANDRSGRVDGVVRANA